MLSEQTLTKMEELATDATPPRYGPLTLEQARTKLAAEIAAEAPQIAREVRMARALNETWRAMYDELVRITRYACPKEPCDCAQSLWVRPIRAVIAKAKQAGGG